MLAQRFLMQVLRGLSLRIQSLRRTYRAQWILQSSACPAAIHSLGMLKSIGAICVMAKTALQIFHLNAGTGTLILTRIEPSPEDITASAVVSLPMLISLIPCFSMYLQVRQSIWIRKSGYFLSMLGWRWRMRDIGAMIFAQRRMTPSALTLCLNRSVSTLE